jgi:hypothetical protein
MSAVGVGTLLVNNGIPDCLHGTITEQTGYPVTLSAPLTVNYCGASGAATGFLFTSTNLWSNASIPAFKPPC